LASSGASLAATLNLIVSWSLLEYSGTTAVGAMVGGTAAAQPAQAAEDATDGRA
jgi:hypothetical protein